MLSRRHIITGAAGFAAFGSAAPARAWEPSRPIQLIVGFAPGGGLHLLARAIALPLEPPLQAEAPPPPHMDGALRECGWHAQV